MSNIYGGLQYWLNGQPTLPDLNLVDLKYWLNGQPYTVIGGAPPPPGNKTYVYYESATNTFHLVVDNVVMMDITKTVNEMLKQVKLTDNSDQAPLNLTARSIPVTTPSLNDIYLDDGTNTVSGNPALRRYNGTVWQDL